MLGEILHALKRNQETASGGVNGGVKILEFIQLHPGCRVNFIAETIGISNRIVERYIRQLREQGKIEFRGAPKTGGYYGRSSDF